jgi:ribonuclease D
MCKAQCTARLSLATLLPTVFPVQEAVSLQLLKKANLKYLLMELYGIDNDKTIALSDWTQRPLSYSQLQYGARDVLYLQAMAVRLIDLILNVSLVPGTSTDFAAVPDEEPSRCSSEGAPAPSHVHQDAQHSGNKGAGARHVGEEKVLTAWKRSQTMTFVIYRASANLDDGPYRTTHHLSISHLTAQLSHALRCAFTS